MEEDNGPQTKAVYRTIQIRDGDGNAPGRETGRPNLSGASSDRLVGLQELLEKAPGLFENKSATAHSEAAERIAELERLVGQVTMENALLKKAAPGWKPPGGETGHAPALKTRNAGQNVMPGLRLSAQHVLL